MARITDWSIPGSDGEPILGHAHHPEGAPRAVLLVAHGFKGYKDYGMFPRLAAAGAEAGCIAHRFNFSHSGMTSEIDSFARPDLFERDTWNRQVFDLRAVMHAVHDGRLDGAGLPCVLFGHSRGGVTVLLTAGRFADDPTLPSPAGIVTAATPSRCAGLAEEEARRLLEQGFLASPSSRTGQALRVGREWLQEQIDDPAGHDLPALVARIRCPLLFIHGTDDPTVPAACAEELRAAATAEAEVLLVAGGDHVFNTPNPCPPEAPSSPQLERMLVAMQAFIRRVTG